MSSETLARGIKKMRQENTNIHSLLIIRNNKIVLDAYFHPFQKGYAHDMASVTKSFMAILTGIAIDKGFIKDENQYVITYFPEYVVKNDTLLQLKIRDLINMASGLRCSWYNGERELQQMNKSTDWVKYMFDLRFERLPYTGFSYCSGNFYLLAEIIQRATKMSCHDFAKKYLFEPMGFSDTFWEKNSKGVNHGWGDLFVTPYDLAKLGCLVLNDGRWNDKQLISKEFLDKIKPMFKIQRTESYGYGWWLDSENPDEMQAVGRGGQRLFILKNSNIVVATTGGGYEAGDIDNLVLESVRDFKKNKDNRTGLDSLVNKIRHPDTAIRTTGNSLPADILNRDIQFGKNDLDIKTIRLEQRHKETFISFLFSDGTVEEHPVGMNNEYIVSKGSQFGLPVAFKGQWDNDGLTIYYNELCKINLLKLSFKFSGKLVDLVVKDQTDGWTKSLKGKLNSE